MAGTWVSGPGLPGTTVWSLAKMLNLSGLQACGCKQERLAEEDFKELEDIDSKGRGESIGEEQRMIHRLMTKVCPARAESLCLAVGRLCLIKLWVYPKDLHRI